MPGNVTYYNSGGCSTIDYAVVSHSLIGKIKYFNVQTLTHLSDHCMIKLGLTLHRNSHLDEHIMTSKLESLPIRYKWNEAGKEKLMKTLQAHQTQSEIKSLKSQDYNSLKDIDTLCQKITDIYKVAANCSLQRVKQRKNTHKKNAYTYQENKSYQALKSHLSNIAK